jgi:cytochrome c biogenesis protein CcmG, thiol:disulfide interchange protein DsbE
MTPIPEWTGTDDNSPVPDPVTTHDRWRLGRRRPMAIGGLIALVALVTLAIWLAQSNSPMSSSDPLVGRTGQPAPAFSLRTLANPGRDVTLATFRGRPLVINFWASWCVPCRTEMPLLEQAFRAEHGRVQFLGIDANDTPGAARDFLNQVHVAYPVVSDETAVVATQFRLFGLPTTVFISSSGKIVGRVIGQLHGDSLRAALKEAFHA